MGQYLTVTAIYWAFTLSDGALRMLVLFHFFKLGYSPFTLALLFLLYEAAGIIANLTGGWLATRFGIQVMLAAGLTAQIAGFVMLAALPEHWTAGASVAWVVIAQGVCGVAKDLTKTASKSAIKLTEAEARGQAAGRLYRWVAWFTGSKNAMKGAGFFLGGLLLQMFGFRDALLGMAVALLAALLGVVLFVPAMMGKARASGSVREFFGKSAGVNLLAAARVFLFGARDIWFVVALPVFLYAQGWSFLSVGTFLALWTIGYGIVQALAPGLMRHSADGLSEEVPAARLWSFLLALTPLAILAALQQDPAQPAVAVAGGLLVFGFLFAANSSVHSYLVLAYAGSEKAAEDVGFYYAANAAGRFLGTALSGALYQWGEAYGASYGLRHGGIETCLAAAFAMLLLCALISLVFPVTAGTEPGARAA